MHGRTHPDGGCFDQERPRNRVNTNEGNHGISYGFAQAIVHDDLGYHQVCVHWVPKQASGANVAS